MYLLLDNNKYLHQIIESLFFCLKQNNINCEIVNHFEKKSELLEISENKADYMKKKSKLLEICENREDHIEKKSESLEKKSESLEINENKADDIYIIFNINIIKEEDLPCKYIVYNFEQLITDRDWDSTFFNKCKSAIKVLDYSLENIKIFKQNKIYAHHLPFGWCSVLEPTYDLYDKRIDILFLGTLNNKRLNIINDINRRNINTELYIHDKCFTKDFDKITSQSKVGINIHYYDGKSILELTRIIPFICAGIHVISERSNDRYYDKIFNNIITFCKKDDMPYIIKDAVNSYNIKEMLRKKRKLKKKLNFEKIISKNINLFKNI